MKIVAETLKIDVNTEISKIEDELKMEYNGTLAEKSEIRTEDIFVALANKFSDVTFILLDCNEKIIGWRN